MDLLPLPSSGRVHVGLDDGFVFAQKLEINLVLRFVAFQRRQVEAAVQAARVACRRSDLCTEDACVYLFQSKKIN